MSCCGLAAARLRICVRASKGHPGPAVSVLAEVVALAAVVDQAVVLAASVWWQSTCRSSSSQSSVLLVVNVLHPIDSLSPYSAS
jgi:hypothetical protein